MTNEGAFYSKSFYQVIIINSSIGKADEVCKSNLDLRFGLAKILDKDKPNFATFFPFEN